MYWQQSTFSQFSIPWLDKTEREEESPKANEVILKPSTDFLLYNEWYYIELRLLNKNIKLILHTWGKNEATVPTIRIIAETILNVDGLV